MLCSWARHFTLTVPLSTQVHELVPANLMLGVGCRNILIHFMLQSLDLYADFSSVSLSYTQTLLSQWFCVSLPSVIFMDLPNPGNSYCKFTSVVQHVTWVVINILADLKTSLFSLSFLSGSFSS